MIKGKRSLSIFLFLCCSLLGYAQINPTFDPIPASFNINSPNPVQALDINYDNEDPGRQAFHIFLPDTTGPYPLVIFIHGGGFTGGSRDIVITNPTGQATIKFYLDQGFAFASVGYRLLSTTQPDSIGVIKSLNDSKRALQFIRHHASDLFIDPDKIALSGSSAGAGTCLWLATRDDMAEPASSDPVLRESTRVCAVETSISQATYDLYKWETDVYQDFDGQGTNFTIDSIVNELGFQLYSNFYGGLDSNYQIINDPALIQYRQDVDMLFHLSADDPPLYIRNTSSTTHPSQDVYHHSLHAKVLHDAALAANLPEVKADVSAQGINTTQGESGNDFLVRHLGSCSLTGIAEESTSFEVLVFPNPADQFFTIKTVNGSISRLELFSITGRKIQMWESIPSTPATLALPTLSPGIYLIAITDDQGRQMARKLMVH